MEDASAPLLRPSSASYGATSSSGDGGGGGGLGGPSTPIQNSALAENLRQLSPVLSRHGRGGSWQATSSAGAHDHAATGTAEMSRGRSRPQDKDDDDDDDTRLIVDEDLDDRPAYALSRHHLGELGLCEAGGPTQQEQASKLQSLLLKLEVIRDFFQILSLMSFFFPSSFEHSFGNASQGVSLDLRTLAEKHHLSISSTTVFFGLLLATWVVLAIFERIRRTDPDMRREGLEVRTWGRRSDRDLLINKALMTVLTTLYLPVTTSSLRVIVWDSSLWTKKVDGTYDTSCYSGSALPVFAAYAAVLSVTLYVPYMAYRLVQDTKPRAIEYDEDGNPQEFTADQYAKALERDKCPYKFMYEGFTREWAEYKVFMMAFKVLMVLGSVVPQSNNCLFADSDAVVKAGDIESSSSRASTVILLVVLLAQAAFSVRHRAFLDWTDNLLTGAGAVTNAFTAFMGVIIVFGGAGDHSAGVALIFVNAINLCVMIVPYVAQSEFLRRRWKLYHKSLDLTAGPDTGDESKPLVFHEDLDLDYELKVRVWRPFWDGLLLRHPAYEAPNSQRFQYSESVLPGCSYAYLLDFEGTVAERHAENKYIVRTIGRDSYCTALSQELGELHERVVRLYVGLDCAYHGRFGKVVVVPFPWILTFISDTGGETTLTEARDLEQYMVENDSPHTAHKREMRHALRALDGQIVHFHHTEVRTKTKYRTAYRDVYNAATKRNERQAYQQSYTVQVQFTFENGTFGIGTERKTMWHSADRRFSLNVSAGFAPRIHYSDGRGRDHEGQLWTGERTTIKGAQLGFNLDHAMTPDLNRLLQHPGNAAVIGRRVGLVKQSQAEYRRHYDEEFRHKRQTMSYEFWRDVYDNPSLSRDELLDALGGVEQNPDVASPPEEALDLLFTKMDYLRSHPLRKFWFIFWDDVFEQNQDLWDGKTKDPQQRQLHLQRRRTFDSSRLDSIAFRPMHQEELLAVLLQHGLRERDGTGFFSDAVLMQLNDAMGQYAKE